MQVSQIRTHLHLSKGVALNVVAEGACDVTTGFQSIAGFHVFRGGEKRKKYVKMATVQSESEQPLDNKLINGTLADNKPELQPAAATVADCDAEVCAQGSGVKGTTEPGVPSSPASENSSPHGAALSPRNKDESGMSCNRKSTVDEQKTDVLFENNGDLVSAEPATDCRETSDRLHNENIGK